MLKAIITIIDEDNKVLSANMLVEECNAKPIPFATEHEFYFKFATANMDLINRFNKQCEEFILSADEIKESLSKEGTE